MNHKIEDDYAERIWEGELTPSDTSISSNTALVSRIWNEIWNQGDLEASEAVFSREYVGHLPMMQVHGPQEFMQLVRIYRQAYPDVHVSVEDVFGERDRIVVRWTSRGTHLGEMMGIPPSGHTIEVMGISIFRIEAGKVVEEWEGFDTLGMMQQIGAIPASS